MAQANLVPALVSGMEVARLDCSWVDSNGLRNAETMLRIILELSTLEACQVEHFVSMA